MNRVKTFDSTGIAPNGRLFAGDLNLIQDAAAALSDFSQHIQTNNLAVGDSSLVLSKTGTGVLSLTSILSILSGITPGSFSTTARNAIAAGKRPTSLIIFNTTTGNLEINTGTDAAPVWQAIGAEPAGKISMYGGSAAPTGWILCDGSAVSRTTFAALFAAIGTTYGVGDGSTTFNVPDFRGRVGVGLGTHADVDALSDNDGLAVGLRRPKHKHSVSDPGHTHTTTVTPNVGAGPGSSGTLSGMGSGVTGSSGTGVTVGPQTGNEPTDGPAYQTVNFIIKS